MGYVEFRSPSADMRVFDAPHQDFHATVYGDIL